MKKHRAKPKRSQDMRGNNTDPADKAAVEELEREGMGVAPKE